MDRADKELTIDFDTAVKLKIYETIARTTKAPTSAEIAEELVPFVVGPCFDPRREKGGIWECHRAL